MRNLTKEAALPDPNIRKPNSGEPMHQPRKMQTASGRSAIEQWPCALVAALLALAAALPYLPTLHNTLLSDDWDITWQAAMSGKGPLAFFVASIGHLRGPFYRPVVDALSFGFNWWASGANPFSYHALNILVHVGVTLLAWRLLLRVFRSSSNGSTLAFASTLLFAVHPRHSEAVTCVFGRCDSIYSLFLLAALLLHLRYRETKQPLLYVAAALAFLLGMMSKESTIVFLLLAPLGERFLAAGLQRRTVLRAVCEWAGYLAVLALYMALRHHSLGTSIGGYGGDEAAGLDPRSMVRVSASAALAMIVPGNINMLQPLLWLNGHTGLAAVVGTLALAITLWLMVRARSAALWKAFAIAVIGFLPSLMYFQYISLANTLAERRIYFSSIGACAVIAVLVWKYIAREQPRAFLAIWAVILVFYTGSLVQVNRVWGDASRMAENIIVQTRALVTDTPEGSKVGFLGLPDNLSGAYVFRVGLPQAVNLTGGPMRSVWQMAPTAPERGKPLPATRWTRSGMVITGQATAPYFKFNFVRRVKRVDEGAWVREPVGTLSADLARGVRLQMRREAACFLAFDEEGVHRLSLPDVAAGGQHTP